jgi:hypothetical protein
LSRLLKSIQHVLQALHVTKNTQAFEQTAKALYYGNEDMPFFQTHKNVTTDQEAVEVQQ